MELAWGPVRKSYVRRRQPATAAACPPAATVEYTDRSVLYAGRAQPRTAKETVTVPVRGKSESLSLPVQYNVLYRLPRSLFTGVPVVPGTLQNGNEPFS